MSEMIDVLGDTMRAHSRDTGHRFYYGQHLTTANRLRFIVAHRTNGSVLALPDCCEKLSVASTWPRYQHRALALDADITLISLPERGSDRLRRH